MGKDIAFVNVNRQDEFLVVIGNNPLMVQGNALLANIFEMTFLTNLNDSLMSYGYGGEGVNTVKMAYDSNDVQSIAAMMKIACDNTVLAMVTDQANNPNDIPNTEKIVSASIVSVVKNGDVITSMINIVPVEYEPQYIGTGLNLSLPI